MSLGAGGLGIAQATSPAGAGAYVAISPCRLLDTRNDPQFHIGNFTTLGADTKLTANGWGTQGECNLPADTTSLELNVTAIGATAPTYLTLYPGAGDPPNASHLNPAPGQPPTPNAVTVPVDGAGSFTIFNKNGTVDTIVDVVGYYTDHHHDDRYYTRAEIDAATAGLTESLEGKAAKLQTVMIPGNAFAPGNSTTSYFASPYDGAYAPVNNAILDAPVVLPAGAQVTTVRYHVRDTHASFNLAMALRSAAQPSGSDAGTVSAITTSAAPGHTALTDGLATPHVVQPGTSYFVRVTSAGWGTAAGDLRIKGVEIEYVLPSEVLN